MTGSLQLTAPTIALGLITGMAYGLLAVGLVLVYRANKVINFAHGEIGAFGAAVFGVAVLKWHLPYWFAVPIALTVSAAVGAASEVAVVRRLRRAPKLMSLVATLGVGQLLLFSSLLVTDAIPGGARFPQPSGLPTIHIGSVLITQAYVGILLLSPVVVAGLVLFLSRTRYGLAIRAAAANPEAARMAGVFAARMSGLAWAIAGAIAALTSLLLKPTLGFVASESLGPNLLLRALVAAVVARMQSLPVALVAGVGVGVFEQVLVQSYPAAGTVELVLFVVILGVLLLQARGGGRDEEHAGWSSVQPWPPLGARLRARRVGRALGQGTGLLALVLAAVVPLFSSNQVATSMTVILAIATIGLSVGIVTGLAGQLSLGQFGLSGIGAAVSVHVADGTGSFPLAFLAAGIATALASIVIGLPALRIRGLLLAVTTLAFALAASGWLLQQPWMLGAGKVPGRPIFFDRAFDTGHTYYLFAVFVVALCLLLARNVWRSGLARRLRALRDNEDAARAFGVAATRVKLETFALAGFFAGVGGALYGHSISLLKPGDFSVSANVQVIALAVIGGIGLMAGPVVGALYIIGIPRFLPDIGASGLAASSLGWLLLLLYFPGGLAQLMAPGRAAVLRVLGIEARPEAIQDPEPPSARSIGIADTRRAISPSSGTSSSVILEVAGVSKRFGGVRAVDGVDLVVARDETLGLIGPNGAGKTTLFEMIGGFTRPDEGRISFDGTDVTAEAPEARVRRGLVRSFQDAALFPTLTVLETVELACDRRDPTRTIPALIGATASERRRRRRAEELIELMGLTAYADKQTGELSTGTRRITELTCVVALEPTLLLLDEPSSGVAQRETEALAELLGRVKQHLGATLIVIEHDMPLIMGMADRIVALESGRVIASGTPAEVQNDPLVLESYLGQSAIAISRSGNATPQRSASTRRKGVR